MRIIIFTLMLFVFGSCAFFRYHSTLVNKPDRKIKNVAVLVAVDRDGSDPRDVPWGEPDLDAKLTVAEYLADLNAFDFKILERNISPQAIHDLNEDLASELRQNYDAYITIIVNNYHTRKVSIEMRETNSSGTLLIRARHSAFPGGTEETVRVTMDLFAKEWQAIE